MFGNLNIIIVGIFRFMLVRLTWEFLMQISRMISSRPKLAAYDTDEDIDFLIEDFQMVLPRVINALHLNDDDVFCELNSIILKHGADYFKQNTDYMSGKFQHEHKRLCRVLNIPLLEYSTHPVQRQSEKATTVIGEIQLYYKDTLEFDLYQSYIKFINDYSVRISMFLQNCSTTTC